MAGEKSVHEGFLLLYGTCPDMETARDIGKKLVEEGLVACVNMMPACHSIYVWQGAVEESEEVVLIGKTTASNWRKLEATYQKLHPYDEPALVGLDISHGLPGFLGWIAKVTTDN